MSIVRYDPDVRQHPRHLSTLAFKSRFTTNELIAIKLAGVINPAAAVSQQQQAAAIAVASEKVDAATYIDLDRQDTREGVLQMETVGLIAPGRALEILDAPVQDIERYRG